MTKCGTCVYAVDWPKYDGYASRCAAPDDPPPTCQTRNGRNSVWPADGATCPAHRAKGTKVSDHSILAPSHMGTLRYCPGSIQLQILYPEDSDSQDAREGTASHWAGSEQLDGRLVDVGQIAPNHVVLDVPMIEGADMYVEAVRKIVPVGGQVEQRVDCSIIHPLMWGTPDFWHYDPATLTLHVSDYKYGRRFVEVYECWQLIAYALGIITSGACGGQVERIVMTIVQPRSYHRDGPVRTWTIPRGALMAFLPLMQASSRAAVREDGTFNPDAMCVVNPGCRDCTGRRACVTLQTAGMADIDLAGAPTPFDLSPVALGNELRMIQRAIAQLEARASGLEEQAISTMTAGTDVPWFRLDRTQGREKWMKSVGEVLALGDMFDLNLRKKPEAITPVQARAAGVPENIIALYSARPGGEVKLMPDDGSHANRVGFGTAP